MGMFSNILDIEPHDNRSEHAKKKQAAEERAIKLEIQQSANEFKPYRCMVPFAGPMAVRLAGSYKSTDLHVSEFDYGINHFLVYREDMRKIDPGDWVVGTHTDGSVRLVTPYGLAYIVDEPITEGEFKDYVVFTDDGVPVLSAEGMLAVIGSRKFIKYEPSDIKWIRYHTVEEVSKRKKEMEDAQKGARVKMEAAYTKTLTDLGVEVTSETLTLLNFIETHDYFASYSDDARVWRYHSEREKKATEYLKKYPALMDMFKQRHR